MGIREFPNGASFFESHQNTTTDDGLWLQQIDPSQPSVDGLELVADPVIPDRYVPTRLQNFDPEVYDLRDSSHLLRLMRALLGAAGVGGYRRSLAINRMGAALSGTHFLDLDGFWGALFQASRLATEQFPSGLDPMQDVTDADTWDVVSSRDASYRSRITALARAFTYGGTYDGIIMAAEALLGCDVDLVESWPYADDYFTLGGPYSNTYFVVQTQRSTWGGMSGLTWAQLQGGNPAPGQSPLGNRSEVILYPERPITEDDRQGALQVLSALKPASVLITLNNGAETAINPVPAQSFFSDSEDWDIVTTIADPLSGDTVPGLRPAFGRYSGEQWSYNTRITSTLGYTIDAEGFEDHVTPDYQVITFLDGDVQDYPPSSAVLDPRQAQNIRLAAEGVQTTFPYSSVR